MTRINVFLKDELLEKINEEAKEEGTNRAAARVLWKLKRRILSVSQKETGSWGESDRGGTRLCKKVHKVLAEWKIFLDVIG
jgi:hypothetical protein